MEGKLIIVGTPIGNLGDISKRAIETLKDADFIAAEDTRVTVKLLNYFGIKKPMVSYFDHNKERKGDFICNRILAGETCVLVSDAGMPAISDPGEDLVNKCVEEGIQVTVVPGPTAFVSALTISGLSTGRFTFEGFLSVNKTSRKKHLELIKKEYRTMLFYEAPHKLSKTLCDLYDALGNRKIAIVREITKLHEEVIRTDLKSASEKYLNEDPKGEIVLVIEGYPQKEDNVYSLEDGVLCAENYLDEGVGLSEAAKLASKKTGIKKGEIYKKIIQLSQQ